MPDEPIVAPGEQAEPVQSPQEPEQPVQDIQEPGELEVLRGQVSNLEKVLGEQGKTIGDLKNDFKGIETETINMVNNLVQSSPNIPAATLENPTTWYGVADMIRGEKARQTTPPVNPVSSTAIDTPAPVRPNEPEKQIDMGIAQELVDEFYGGDRELATKSARASRERGEK